MEDEFVTQTRQIWSYARPRSVGTVRALVVHPQFWNVWYSLSVSPDGPHGKSRCDDGSATRPAFRSACVCPARPEYDADAPEPTR